MPIKGGDILTGMPVAVPGGKAVKKAAAPAAAARAKPKAPMKNAESITITRAAGGYVIRGNSGAPGWKTEEAIAADKEQRDALIDEMLGE